MVHSKKNALINSEYYIHNENNTKSRENSHNVAKL